MYIPKEIRCQEPECNQQVELHADTTQELVWQEHITGRKTFGGEKEVVMVKVYPLKRTNFCYFHNKRQEYLISNKEFTR